MGTPPRKRPIPREEPAEEAEPASPEPTTLRPPAFGPEESSSSNYKMLSESCRADEAEERSDEELAVEAEIVRVALDRTSSRVKAKK
jgi:hypothetical protein